MIKNRNGPFIGKARGDPPLQFNRGYISSAYEKAGDTTDNSIGMGEVCP
jgi:hypothetical protein